MVRRAKNAPSPVFPPIWGEKVSEIWNIPPHPTLSRQGEGKHKKEIPSPLMGEGEGGGELGGYFTASERERVRGKFLFSRFAGVSRVIRNY